MATITRKGDHHKVRELPVGELVTIGLLLLAVIGLLAGLFAVTSTQANASTVSYLRPAVTAAHTFKPPACNWRTVHRLDRYTTWQYVTPRLARYEHIGLCSKVIGGQDQSVIVGQDGHVADVS